MDPMSGQVGRADVRQRGDTAGVQLRLESGQSLIVRAFDHAVDAPRWSFPRPTGPPVEVRGRWTVDFLDGGPVLPRPFVAPAPVPWTDRGDADADRFAGTARYTVVFDAPDSAPDHLLTLGRVAESARVRLNGVALGTLIARPFQLRTGRLLARGNRLEIEVTNLSANRIRDLDRRGVRWKIFRDINYVDIAYKPFDASGWPVRPSGLLGPVMLTPVR
jgi:hypothetical protein